MIPHGYRKSLWDLPAQPPLAPPPDSYGVLFGSALRALWRSDRGASFDGADRELQTWTETVNGAAVTPFQPGSGAQALPDGNNFNGRPVVCLTNGARLGNPQAFPPGLLGTGLSLHLFVVARVSTYPSTGGATRVFVQLSNVGGEQAGLLYLAGSPSRIGYSYGNNFTQQDSSDTAVQLLEVVQTPDEFALYSNGVELGSGSPGSYRGAPVGIRFGQTTVETLEYKAAMVGLVAPAPTDAKRARLLELARDDWGF